MTERPERPDEGLRTLRFQQEQMIEGVLAVHLTPLYASYVARDEMAARIAADILALPLLTAERERADREEEAERLLSEYADRLETECDANAPSPASPEGPDEAVVDHRAEHYATTGSPTCWCSPDPEATP